jgi:lipoic acid synthetase
LAVVNEQPAPADKQPIRKEPKPPWLKVRAPGGDKYTFLKQTMRRLELSTVCEEARCPNVGECWNAGTATMMILGDTCTRGCRFCAVSSGNPHGAVDPREPEHVAKAVAELGLRFVVLTMVDRDDLLDGGAAQMANTVSAIRRSCPSVMVETLVGDFAGHERDIQTVLASEPDVFGHNLEVVRRLTPIVRDKRCAYDQSLQVLSFAKLCSGSRMVKSSLMVGVGETDDELLASLVDLASAGVDIVTIGQYLQPTSRHYPVQRYVTPEQFAAFERFAYGQGFAYVASGPLVRSSFHAAEGFVEARRSPASPEHGAPIPRAAPAAGALVPAEALTRRQRDR